MKGKSTLQVAILPATLLTGWVSWNWARSGELGTMDAGTVLVGLILVFVFWLILATFALNLLSGLSVKKLKRGRVHPKLLRGVLTALIMITIFKALGPFFALLALGAIYSFAKATTSGGK